MPKILELNKRNIEKVSIICPYYNEEVIIKDAVERLVKELAAFQYSWELILVNDGSTDRGFDLVEALAKEIDNLILITYPCNQGRGYALKKGIEKASGDIIITTEIDLSWGESIIQRFIAKFEQAPDLDCLIASPNIRGGGYKNVPFKRVLVSKVGNFLIRLFFVPKITMNTGMTRGYWRQVIQGINAEEKGKEFHLEILLKIYTLGYRIGEIPATLEWKNYKDRLAGKKTKGKSGSHISQLMKTHLKFIFFARPIRYFWAISFFLSGLSFLFFVYAVYRLLTGEVSIFMALMFLLLAIFSLLFFGFGVIADQNMSILKELWRENNIKPEPTL